MYNLILCVNLLTYIVHLTIYISVSLSVTPALMRGRLSLPSPTVPVCIYADVKFVPVSFLLSLHLRYAIKIVLITIFVT
jgi:hypothetical protein